MCSKTDNTQQAGTQNHITTKSGKDLQFHRVTEVHLRPPERRGLVLYRRTPEGPEGLAVITVYVVERPSTFLLINSSYLEDADVRQAVRTVAAAVDLDVLQPLDVRLRVAEHFALELHVAAHHCGAVCWEAGLKDRPVRGAFCRMEMRRNYSEQQACSEWKRSEHSRNQASPTTSS